MYQTSSHDVASFFGSSSSSPSFGPKLSIKLQDDNYLLWNQQVKGVILSHKLHNYVVNPRISHMFKINEYHLQNIVST